MRLKTVSALAIILLSILTNKVTAQDVNTPNLTATGGEEKQVSLGSLDPNSGYKYLLQLTTRGAAIEKATFSGFTDLNRKNKVSPIS